MAVAPVFLDTSVILGGLLELSGASDPAQRIMDAVAEGRLGRPHTAWHCCLEFYAVATRLPEEYRLAPADAGALLEGEILPRFHVHDLPPSARKHFLAGSVRERAAGGRIYDAHIAEVARRTRARVILTENVRHFAPLAKAGTRVMSAQEFVADSRI